MKQPPHYRATLSTVVLEGEGRGGEGRGGEGVVTVVTLTLRMTNL